MSGRAVTRHVSRLLHLVLTSGTPRVCLGYVLGYVSPDEKPRPDEACRDAAHSKQADEAHLATCGLRLATCDLRLATCSLRLATCGLQLAACGLQLATRNSQLVIPPSKLTKLA